VQRGARLARRPALAGNARDFGDLAPPSQQLRA